jgi:hypothetical protein
MRAPAGAKQSSKSVRVWIATTAARSRADRTTERELTIPGTDRSGSIAHPVSDFGAPGWRGGALALCRAQGFSQPGEAPWHHACRDSRRGCWPAHRDLCWMDVKRGRG